MEIEERPGHVEGRVDKLEDRKDLIEQAILQMRDILLRHDDRLDDYYSALRESRENFDFKMNALIDAQLKNESEIVNLKEASKSQLNRIEKLEEN